MNPASALRGHRTEDTGFFGGPRIWSTEQVTDGTLPRSDRREEARTEGKTGVRGELLPKNEKAIHYPHTIQDRQVPEQSENWSRRGQKLEM